MADKIFEDEELVTKRFSCACLYPHHILDLSVEYADKGKRFVECSLEFSINGKAPFKYRLKQIWNLICGKDGEMCDFILRKEDVGELIEMLERIKCNEEIIKEATMKLELEVTEELMGKIEAAAKESLVTPSHWATCNLKDIFIKKESPKWLPVVPPILRSLAGTLESMLAEKIEKTE